jgi:hypothetical protein
MRVGLDWAFGSGYFYGDRRRTYQSTEILATWACGQHSLPASVYMFPLGGFSSKAPSTAAMQSSVGSSRPTTRDQTTLALDDRHISESPASQLWPLFRRGKGIVCTVGHDQSSASLTFWRTANRLAVKPSSISIATLSCECALTRSPWSTVVSSLRP